MGLMSKLLDVAGPADVFAEANRLGANYAVELISPTGSDVVTSVGITLSVESAAAEVGSVETFLVAGGDLFPTSPVDADLAGAAAGVAAGLAASAPFWGYGYYPYGPAYEYYPYRAPFPYCSYYPADGCYAYPPYYYPPY